MSHHRNVPFGEHLRSWRQRRGWSQLRLALDAGVSARHLSFVETGRATPSREMVVLLAQQLEIPLRDRNTLLLAAGYAPSFEERPLDAPEMEAVRKAVDLVLSNHEPFPAIAVDRAWNVVTANRAASILSDDVPPHLLGPPANVYRVSLHPDGLVRRLSNFAEYASHLLAGLRHDVRVSGDPRLAALLHEVEAYETVRRLPQPDVTRGVVALSMRIRDGDVDLALITTIATFGTPFDVTVSELAIESFFPADEPTAARLRALATARDCGGPTGLPVR